MTRSEHQHPRARARRRTRRVGVAAIVLGATLAAGALPALAGGPTVGEPQPELVKYKVGGPGGDGTGAILSNKVVVLASPSSSGTEINVCVLHPASRSCVTKATLRAYHGGGNQDSFSGPIEVFATGGAALDIVAYDCCYIGANGIVVFRSTDGGATWGPETQAGDLGDLGAATYAGGSIVVATSEYHDGTQVQAISPDPTVAQTSYAQVSTDEYDTSVTNYRNGVLLAYDNLTNTRVAYAKAGSGFNTASSYKPVGAFNNEQTVAVSGNALLTDPGGSLTHGIRLRFFNGTSFGPAYKVPEPKNPDDGYFTEQETGPWVHVFFIARRSGYDLMTESTTNGKRWTPLTAYSTAIVSSSLSPVLNAAGNGVVFENDGSPQYAQPILTGVRVSLHFLDPVVKAGHTAVLKGGASPGGSGGQRITLEKLVSGKWYPVKSIVAATVGFTFDVPGIAATYRAVVNWVPGSFQYGYSNAATLRVTT